MIRGAPSVDPTCPEVDAQAKGFTKEHAGLMTLRQKGKFWGDLMRKHIQTCQRCRIFSQEAGADFHRGVPSFEEVEAHEREHVFIDDRGHAQGAIWLVIDDAGTFGPHPQLLHLRAGKEHEEILDSEKGVKKIDVTGKVLLQNGHTFWQLLERCVWAARSVYVPCTARGIPLRWKEDR